MENCGGCKVIAGKGSFSTSWNKDFFQMSNFYEVSPKYLKKWIFCPTKNALPSFESASKKLKNFKNFYCRLAENISHLNENFLKFFKTFYVFLKIFFIF